jgi:erythromycin esterase
VVGENFTWGSGNAQENADLVQWMREYNADPAHRRKISSFRRKPGER